MMEGKKPAPDRAAVYRCLVVSILVLDVGMAACFLTQTPASDTKVKREQWRESRGPVVPHDSFPSDCTLCHAKGSWHEIRQDFVFDHAKETGTPLTGAHEHAQCLRCHNDRGSVANFSKRGCAGCHEDLHRGRLGIQCISCHTDTNWNPTGIYAAHARTRFPLTAAHLGVACNRCHPAADSGQFLGADPRCEACHINDALAVKSPNHAAQGLLSDCARCHSEGTWAGAKFSHVGIVTGCVNCHQADYNGTTNPNHAAAGYPTNCETCHNTSSWLGAVVHVHTSPPLTGPHNIACIKCHTVPTNFAIHSCTPCHNGTPGGKIKKGKG
jgi:hypothetical protein